VDPHAQPLSALTEQSSAGLPSRDQELALHERLLAHEVLASSDLAAAYMDYLVSWLVRRNRLVAEELCVEAAGEAILTLIRNPGSYNPKRQALIAYLRMSAQGDLRNLLRKARRLEKNQVSLESVEQSPQAGKYLGRDDDPSLPLRISEDLASADEQLLAPVKQGLSAGELAALSLILAGERKTSEYALALGIAHLPKDEQEKEVKRVKGKVNKRLERARARHEQSY